MIVIGIDPHKDTHTAVALDGATGQVRAELTVAARTQGFEQVLGWARRMDSERTFAVEDCRHVSGPLERFLIGRGETSVRVPPKLMALVRRSAREAGKSDPIDARAVASAALRETDLPKAQLAGPERDVALLVDHRDDLVAERTRVCCRLRWLLHDLDPDLAPASRSLTRKAGLNLLEHDLRGREGSVTIRICLEQVARCAELTHQIAILEREITAMARTLSPGLLAFPGCGGLTAAKILSETAGASRFRSQAAFAMHAGVAPLAVSSGRINRFRLNRTGNRQLNAALHRIAVTQMRCHPPAIAYVERKRAEGKSTRETLRCLKRHIAKSVFKILIDESIAVPLAVRGSVTVAA